MIDKKLLYKELNKDILDDNKILELIPELKILVDFPHNNPNHHLDIWKHTKEVVYNLKSSNNLLKVVGLLHDIGKPYVEVKDDKGISHYRNHQTKSQELSANILKRFNFTNEEQELMLKLILEHDDKIDINNINKDNKENYKILLELQYADALAHHPGFVKKRLQVLDNINSKIM